MPTEYVIPGDKLTSEAEFYRVMGEVINGPDGYFGSNLDAFWDCLAGGWGTPDEFTLRWKNSEISKNLLGYPATIEYLESMYEGCHPSNKPTVQKRLEAAMNQQGPTLYDEIVELIREAENVTLILE